MPVLFKRLYLDPYHSEDLDCRSQPGGCVVYLPLITNNTQRIPGPPAPFHSPSLSKHPPRTQIQPMTAQLQ